MAEGLSEEFVGCFVQPHEVVSEVSLAEIGGVAMNNCTGFGERPWDTEVNDANIERWQTAINDCPARSQNYCNNYCHLQTTLEEIRTEFINSQK